MGDSSETKTKVLSRELFLGVVALKMPVPQNHYLRDKVPFPKSGHKFFATFFSFYSIHNLLPFHAKKTFIIHDEALIFHTPS